MTMVFPGGNPCAAQGGSAAAGASTGRGNTDLAKLIEAAQLQVELQPVVALVRAQLRVVLPPRPAASGGEEMGRVRIDCWTGYKSALCGAEF